MRALALGLATALLCLAVESASAKIVHRWSFITDGSDSVGSANAVLRDGAAVSDGRLNLNGSGAYAELPIGGTISRLTNATIEAWVTWDVAQGPWTRIFDIGTGQTAYMFLTPRHGRAAEGGVENTVRFAITSEGFNAEQTVNGPAQFPVAAETHVAVTIDSAAKVARLYIGGKLVATQENVTLTPSALGNTTNNWLGGSQFFETDPTFDGSIAEFRIYDSAQSAEEIAKSFAAGSDKLASDAPAGAIVSRPPAGKLLHRWSFAADAKDTVGTAHGVLRDGAAVAEGRVNLNGNGAYVELPIGGTIARLQNVTIEGWAAWDTAQGPWSRLFDIGTGQAAYMFLTPRHGRVTEGGAENTVRFAITNGGFEAEQQVNGPEQFPTGAVTHFAVTMNGASDVAELYLNGKLVATKDGVTLSPADLGNTTNNWLGGSQYFETDPTFDGSFAEFRIYDGALTAEDIMKSFNLGPDKLVTDAAPAGAVVGQPPAASGLVHRWSFSDEAKDSVGSAHGTLDSGAVVRDGRVVLDGQRAHVALPIGETIEKLTNATIETWVTWDERQRAWLRLFDFGVRGGRSMYITPRNGGGRAMPRNTVRFTITTNGDPGEQIANSEMEFPVGEETHVALTIDAEKDVATLYVNGKAVATRENLTLTPSDFGRAPNNWLGRSQFPSDPYFKGSFSEFRIYNKALSAEQVAKSFQAGPDKVE
jgi:hypothetical protein